MFGEQMRVGILTYHFSDNFGALMQAYGLRQWLLQRGVNAEFINYHPRHVEEGGIQLNRGPKAFAKSVFLTFSQAKRRLFGNKAQAQSFTTFQREVLSVKGARYETVQDLARLDRFDLIVCGSDQIWNPSEQHGLDPVYFADFPGADRARRISYAASFGKSSLADPYHAEAAKLIGKMDAVAVREASGLDVVRSLTSHEPVLVPDPTILHGDFSALIAANPSPSKGHVFCYALRTAQGVREAAHLAAQKTGGSVLSPDNPHRRWPEVGTTVYPSPGEWVSMIDTASVVVTNSFHGVALSILLERPFISVALPGAKAGLSERVRNLLRQLDLEDRLVSAGDEVATLRMLDAPIDWNQVSRKIREMRQAGEAYLEAQIGLAAK